MFYKWQSNVYQNNTIFTSILLYILKINTMLWLLLIKFLQTNYSLTKLCPICSCHPSLSRVITKTPHGKSQRALRTRKWQRKKQKIARSFCSQKQKTSTSTKLSPVSNQKRYTYIYKNYKMTPRSSLDDEKWPLVCVIIRGPRRGSLHFPPRLKRRRVSYIFCSAIETMQYDM